MGLKKWRCWDFPGGPVVKILCFLRGGEVSIPGQGTKIPCSAPWQSQWESLSPVQLFATPWTVACQALLSMGFSRQEYWMGSHALLQGIFPTQGSNLGIPHCRQILYHLRHQGRCSHAVQRGGGGGQEGGVNPTVLAWIQWFHPSKFLHSCHDFSESRNFSLTSFSKAPLRWKQLPCFSPALVPW